MCSFPSFGHVDGRFRQLFCINYWPPVAPQTGRGKMGFLVSQRAQRISTIQPFFPPSAIPLAFTHCSLSACSPRTNDFRRNFDDLDTPIFFFFPLSHSRLLEPFSERAFCAGRSPGPPPSSFSLFLRCSKVIGVAMDFVFSSYVFFENSDRRKCEHLHLSSHSTVLFLVRRSTHFRVESRCSASLQVACADAFFSRPFVTFAAATSDCLPKPRPFCGFFPVGMAVCKLLTLFRSALRKTASRIAAPSRALVRCFFWIVSPHILR